MNNPYYKALRENIFCNKMLPESNNAIARFTMEWRDAHAFPLAAYDFVAGLYQQYGQELFATNLMSVEGSVSLAFTNQKSIRDIPFPQCIQDEEYQDVLRRFGIQKVMLEKFVGAPPRVSIAIDSLGKPIPSL